ncbi:MAG: hypothetical protein LBU86_01520 [Oscillospiraceae bacterium]|jgi:hypothetical protein|nr:hypothetical protein [Oscillospiraceae bacterium]
MRKDEAGYILSAQLRRAVALIDRPGADATWSGFSSPKEAARIIRQLGFLTEDEAALREIRALFGPEGPVREIALASGWLEEFGELAGIINIAVNYLAPCKGESRTEVECAYDR